MQLIKKVVPRNCNIFNIGDDHEGTSLRHDDGWEQMIDMVRSEYKGVADNYVVDHGDIIEAITPDDPRYDDSSGHTKVLAQIEEAISHRLPIADRMICILDGNHPKKLWRFGDITKKICKDIHVPFGTWTAIISYVTCKGNPLFKQFASHGFGAGRSTIDEPEDRENSLKRTLRKKLSRQAGDCAIMSMGHSHLLLIKKPKADLYITSNATRVKQGYTDPNNCDISGASYIDPFNRWYVNTGSFYRLYGNDFSGYAEQAGYNPIELGFAITMIRDGKIVDVKKIVLN